MTDSQIIQQRLKLLAEYVSDLEAVQDTTWEDFLADKRLRRYVERTLQLAIECCLDIGHHVISAEGLREPSDNRDVFRVLAEAGYIPAPQLPDFERMAGFRNLLVHEYARIDPAVVYGVLKKRVLDLKQFAALAARLAEGGKPPSGQAPDELRQQ